MDLGRHYGYDYRRSARIVGIIDLVLAVLSLVGVIAFTVMMVLITVELQKEIHADAGFIAAIWVIVALVFLVVFLNFLAAVKLLQGTALGKNPKDALKLCTCSRAIYIAFACLGVLGLIGSFVEGFDPKSIVSNVVGIVIRSVFIFIISKHISELRTVTSSVVPATYQHNNDKVVVGCEKVSSPASSPA